MNSDGCCNVVDTIKASTTYLDAFQELVDFALNERYVFFIRTAPGYGLRQFHHTLLPREQRHTHMTPDCGYDYKLRQTRLHSCDFGLAILGLDGNREVSLWTAIISCTKIYREIEIRLRRHYKSFHREAS